MPDFTAHDIMKDRFPTKKYPDQSFVNLGDSFSHREQVQPIANNSNLNWPSQQVKDTNLQEKYDLLEAKYNKDKEFYDKALEARTNQLEEKEDAYEQLLSEKK